MQFKRCFPLFLLIAAVALAGCQAAPVDRPPGESAVSSTTERSGEFRLTDPQGAKGVLITDQGEVPIESLVVDLAAFDGTRVTVQGKFSGDTLFVSQVE